MQNSQPNKGKTKNNKKMVNKNHQTPVAIEKTQQEKQKPIPKFVFFITGFLLVITIIAFLPQFRIRQVEFADFNFNAPEAIYASSGIHHNQFFLENMGGGWKEFFEGRYTKAEQKVMKENTGIDSVKIYYQYPSKVVFELKEIIEIGWIKIPDGYCTVDANGKVVSLLKDEPIELPIISGLTVINASVGKKIEVSQDQYLNNAMYTMSSLIEADIDTQGATLLSMITKIEPTINNDIYLTLLNGEQEYTVVCDKSHDLVDDFLWLKRTINSGVLSEETGSIDIRGKNRIFRKDKPAENTSEVTEPEETDITIEMQNP